MAEAPSLFSDAPQRFNMAVEPETRQFIQPRYSFAEADHLAAVSRGTARRWLAGYTYRGRNGHRVPVPPVTPRAEQPDAVSFLDLVEIAAIGGLKDAGFSMAAIRGMVQNCQEILGVARPLTSLRFKVGGREIFVERERSGDLDQAAVDMRQVGRWCVGATRVAAPGE